MATASGKLTALRVRNEKKPGRHSDGDNLYLQVSPSGAKSWLFLYRKDGRLREMGLGGLAKVSLATARDMAAEARKTFALGLDPIAEKRQRQDEREQEQARAKTFGEFADEYIAEHEMGWRNAKHRQQWRNTLMTHGAPLRAKTLDAITTEDVLRVLRPIWTDKAETASRLRGRIEQILDAAKARNLRSGDNPAEWKGNLKHLLAKRDKNSRGHHSALPHEEVPAFVRSLRQQEGVGSLALEFAILTATRTSETLGAKWSEINLEKKLWTIPKERMKSGEEHDVPLSSRALEILAVAAEIRTGEYAFPGRNSKRPLSSMVFLMLLRRMGRGDLTAHGFRSSFRDWAGDKTTFPRDVAEMALAHAVGDKTERAYRREKARDKRRKLIDAWVAYCVRDGSNVVAFQKSDASAA